MENSVVSGVDRVRPRLSSSPTTCLCVCVCVVGIALKIDEAKFLPPLLEGELRVIINVTTVAKAPELSCASAGVGMTQLLWKTAVS